jgi:hemerythrin superfamily protein
MSTDAIVILKEDHKRVRALFRKFQDSSPNAHTARGRIVDDIIQELTVHTYIENEVMYPQVRALVPELEQDVLESYEEHHVADLLVMELLTLAPDAEHFQAKTSVLIESVSHHMDEEENDWFPKVRAALGRKQLGIIGEQLLESKKTAPHRPTQPSALKKVTDALLA